MLEAVDRYPWDYGGWSCGLRRKERYTTAINFWQKWLADVDHVWDGHAQQTFEPALEARTLPPAKYKEAVQMPTDLTDAQVYSPIIMAVEHIVLDVNLQSAPVCNPAD